MKYEDTVYDARKQVGGVLRREASALPLGTKVQSICGLTKQFGKAHHLDAMFIIVFLGTRMGIL